MNENKAIAINTIVLTIKLVITIVCSFVISRLILKALGADNYGLYNVIGGIVSMLALVSTSMVATTYRYIAVERGKGERGNPQKIFSTLMVIHILLAIILLIIGEPIGYYYIENYLNITNATITDAHFVFIFSLVASSFTIVSVPSHGLLIAEEKFLPLSIIEIIRSFFNVALAFFLLSYEGNSLRLYAIFMASLTIGYCVGLQLFCYIKYTKIVKIRINKNKQDYKEILSFTGWTFIGASAVIGRTQGVAMIINLFFKNSINAAFGIANQIGNAAIQFTNTLRQSVTPQIMKNQEGNSVRSLNLVYAISRYTYLIMLIVTVPLLLCMNTILALWLGHDNIPPLTEIFASLLLIDGMIANLKSGFDASIQATGKIRKNQIGYTIINVSIIPIVYILYKIGLPVYMSVITGIILTIVTLIFQMSIMKELTDFSYNVYWVKTLRPSLMVTMVSFIPMIGLRSIIGNSLYIVLAFAAISMLWACLCSFFIGFSERERTSVISFVKSKISKKF